MIANQVVSCLWTKHSDEEKDSQFESTVSALIGIGPRDELEGMMAAQLIAAHNAAMECYRRAMLPEQTFEGRREASLRRTSSHGPTRLWSKHSTDIAEKASKRSRLSTFTCTPADKPWLELSRAKGEGSKENQMINRMLLDMHRAKRCEARTRKGTPCQSPAMANGRCRMHGGPSPGAPKGNKNAWKHGSYSAEAIARRRSISELIAAMKSSAKEVEE
jgi:hypothetical protein